MFDPTLAVQMRCTSLKTALRGEPRWEEVNAVKMSPTGWKMAPAIGLRRLVRWCSKSVRDWRASCGSGPFLAITNTATRFKAPLRASFVGALAGAQALPRLDTVGHTQRDWSQPYVASKEVEQAWLQVYRDPKAHWDLYQLGEELTDLEDAFRLWRFRHVTTVERVIGFKRGTGGTGGVSYLRKMLDVVLFPEIWSLRTEL